MMAAAPTFTKRERMTSHLLMEALFENGSSQSVSAFPLRAVYQTIERHSDHGPAQILISVPKKRFKHAVDRNKVKRQVREAYRKNKHLLGGYVSEGKQLLIAFVWLSDKHCTSAEVEKRVVSLLLKMISRA